LNGLYDAKLDHAPVLAITGMQETQMLGTGYQQEVSLEKLFMDVAVYNEMVRVPAQVSTLVDLAIRHALSRRGVAHLTIPTDIQIADAGANPWEATAPAVIKPTRADLDRAAWCSRSPPPASGGRGAQHRQSRRDAHRSRGAARP